MIELKPCPFCGHKAEMEVGVFSFGCERYANARCVCTICGASSFKMVVNSVEEKDEAKRRAAEGWNCRRCERQCQIVYDNVHQDYYCSSCGEIFDTGMYESRDADDGFDYKSFLYCPNCGAKVEEER